MNTLSKLTKVKYRDGLWKRQVVEYWLWCDEGTEEICKKSKDYSTFIKPVAQMAHEDPKSGTERDSSNLCIQLK